MHPAHPLPSQKVTFGAGVSNNFVLGGADRAIDRARATTVPEGIPQQDEYQDYVEGAIVHALAAPGLAPWVGSRVGLGYDTEGGLTFTGRAVRVDARHAFTTQRLALSIGLGATAILSRQASESTAARDVPGVNTQGVTGWGLDIPVIVGWRSDADLVQVWAGVRAGHERLSGDVVLRARALPAGEVEERAALSAQRWQGGGLVGLAVGVRPFWVGVELDAAYQRYGGKLAWANTGEVEAEGFTLTPTGAVVGKF